MHCLSEGFYCFSPSPACLHNQAQILWFTSKASLLSFGPLSAINVAELTVPHVCPIVPRMFTFHTFVPHQGSFLVSVLILAAHLFACCSVSAVTLTE